LIDNSLKSVLDDTKINEALKKITSNSTLFKDKKIVQSIGDVTDIRKRYTTKIENLGKVRDLDKKIINGFSAISGIFLDESSKTIKVSNIKLFSNGDKNFVSKKEMKLYEDKQLEDKQRVEQIQEAIKDNKAYNLTDTINNHFKTQSQIAKENNSNIILFHTYDRGADAKMHLKYIVEELQDEFGIRAKDSRLSNQTTTDAKGKKRYKKLKDAKFKHQAIFYYDKLTIKSKLYQQAKAVIEWDDHILKDEEEKEFSVVKITLYTRDDKTIFNNPMLIITSLKIKDKFEAKDIYHMYLNRSRIEALFKFLKEILGLEEIQVREFESFKNLVAICFYIGNYFYEIEPELIENEVIKEICELANSKGKVTRYYFIEGLKVLMSAWKIHQKIFKGDISADRYKQMLGFGGVSEEEFEEVMNCWKG